MVLLLYTLWAQRRPSHQFANDVYRQTGHGLSHLIAQYVCVFFFVCWSFVRKLSTKSVLHRCRLTKREFQVHVLSGQLFGCFYSHKNVSFIHDNRLVMFARQLIEIFFLLCSISSDPIFTSHSNFLNSWGKSIRIIICITLCMMSVVECTEIESRIMYVIRSKNV